MSDAGLYRYRGPGYCSQKNEKSVIIYTGKPSVLLFIYLFIHTIHTFLYPPPRGTQMANQAPEMTNNAVKI